MKRKNSSSIKYKTIQTKQSNVLYAWLKVRSTNYLWNHIFFVNLRTLLYYESKKPGTSLQAIRVYLTVVRLVWVRSEDFWWKRNIKKSFLSEKGTAQSLLMKIASFLEMESSYWVVKEIKLRYVKQVKLMIYVNKN